MHLKHKIATAIVAALAATASPGIHAAPRIHALPGHHGNQAPRGTEGAQADPSTCDPFANWDDEIDPDGSGGDDGDDSTTNDLMHWGSSTSMERFDYAESAPQVIGTTPESVAHNFLDVLTRNLANAGTATRIASLSDKELAAIARHAADRPAADRAGLLKLFATRLDGPGLVRVARAFGRAPVEAAVNVYASPAIRTSFTNGIAGLAPPPPMGGGGSYPRPNLNMTLEEIYLEFRTAPVGSLSPSAALAETSMYAGTWLYISYQVGDKVGQEIHELIEEYDPSLDVTLGNIIGSMIENMWLATDNLEQGHFEAAFDDLFGFPVTGSSNSYGDWDISVPMIDYYQWTRTCGY